jgi:hypothetical protein
MMQPRFRKTGAKSASFLFDINHLLSFSYFSHFQSQKEIELHDLNPHWIVTTRLSRLMTASTNVFCWKKK